jgi:hypothetical protein
MSYPADGAEYTRSDKPYTLQVVHVDNALRDMRGSHSTVQVRGKALAWKVFCSALDTFLFKAAYFAYGCLLLSTTPGGGANLVSIPCCVVASALLIFHT